MPLLKFLVKFSCIFPSVKTAKMAYFCLDQLLLWWGVKKPCTVYFLWCRFDKVYFQAEPIFE
jgi:hypothetical protein